MTDFGEAYVLTIINIKKNTVIGVHQKLFLNVRLNRKK
jgi:hypothetical protein